MSSSSSLVEITAPEFNVTLSLAYATPHNFTGQPVYLPRAKCYLHSDAAKCLAIAIEIAKIQGYGIKVFDAYRPPEAQWILWNHTPDPDFLADPRKGSPHSRGVAVDLTLLDADGNEVDMGTAFDAFTPQSHHGNREISAEAQRNRLILMGIMTTAGWDFYRNEWWHYQLFNARANYPLISDEEHRLGMLDSKNWELARHYQKELSA